MKTSHKIILGVYVAGVAYFIFKLQQAKSEGREVSAAAYGQAAIWPLALPYEFLTADKASG